MRENAHQQRETAARQRRTIRIERARLRLAAAPDRCGATYALDADSTTAPAVVAFAASAGSLAPLIVTLGALPPDFPAAAIVAMHTGAGSGLPALLEPRCRLRVKFAENGEPIRGGIVYIAPPLQHVIVNADRTFALSDREHVRFARPSADWLFDTIAATYASSALAVVLSGYQRDGAWGIVRIFGSGGTTIVQEPTTCEAADMPNAAIQTAAVSRILPPERMASAIVAWIRALDAERIGDFVNPFAAA